MVVLLLQAARAAVKAASRLSGWRLFWQTCRAHLTLDISHSCSQGNSTTSSSLPSSLQYSSSRSRSRRMTWT